MQINYEKTIFAAAILILEILIGFYVMDLIPSRMCKAIANTAIILIGLIILIWMFGSVLKENWKLFKKHLA